jgi:CDP-L-myo-inositol myo-inositolphosphotransferase
MQNLIKDTDGFISKHINRKFSTKISTFIVNSGVKISPSDMTVISFLFSILSSVLFCIGQPLFGGITAQLSSILDGCDGEIARLTNSATKKGEILDSILDRLGDGAIIMGLTVLAYKRSYLWENLLPNMDISVLIIILGFLALMGSFNISYSAAKLKASAGLEYRRIWAGRDIRLFLTMLTGLFTQFIPRSLLLFLLLMIVLTFYELIYRISKLDYVEELVSKGLKKLVT